ncbi:MAG: Type 1 glutamine amidotransferase-like domain-containing protein [Candidatus Uhrbacteria bacterium]
MKKLFLTSDSDFFYEHIGEYVDKPLNEVNIAWITTAKGGCLPSKHLPEHRQKMSRQPFRYDEMDIEGKKEDELREMFKDKDIIYVHGGNTFYLLKAIKESNFEKVLKEKMDQGVLYAGTSAGAYVACPTIEMCEWKHDRHYHRFEGQDDLTAMNLVPFLMSVHHEPKYDEDIKKGKRSTDLEVYVLEDGQGIYVEGGEVKVLGDASAIRNQ